MGLPDEIWEAIGSVDGMLKTATFQLPNGNGMTFKVGLKRPDVLDMDDFVKATDYSIEYLTSAVTLKRGDVIRIDGTAYKLTRPPMQDADGDFSTVMLEVLP